MNAPAALSPPAKARTKEELQRTVSASRLGAWLSCRLKFFFRYLSGIPKAPTASLHVGSVIHAVLQEWNLARWRGAPLQGDLVRSLFDQFWIEKQAGVSIRWDDSEVEIRTGAFSLLETYPRQTSIPLDERPEGVEVSVELDLARYGLPTLVGVLDLVRAGGRIVDYKTTGRTPDQDKVVHTTEIQTTAYALLYREATGRRENGIELHHLVRLKSPKIVITQIGVARQEKFQRLIESYNHGLEREDFVPSPGIQCSTCEFFQECRLWY